MSIRHVPLQINRRALIAAPLVALTTKALAAPRRPADVVEARHRCERIAGRFFSELSRMGLEKTGRPSIKIGYTPLRTSYDPNTRTITAPAWSQAPSTLKAQVRTWAKFSSRPMTAEDLFVDIYNGFMIAHESTHAYQADLGFWTPGADRFESEIVANRGAVAFALETPIGAAHLRTLIGIAQNAVKQTPSPAHEGDAERAYFNSRYDQIVQDPALHAWFEARMMLIAWRRRGEMDFPTMMRSLAQAGSRPA